MIGLDCQFQNDQSALTVRIPSRERTTQHDAMNHVEAKPTPTLLIFSDDWGRHPSSCQHLTHHLMARFPVIWVNTIGTRPPRLNLATVGRGFEKLRQWIRPSARPDPDTGPRVLNPRMWPWFRARLDRRLNRTLLLRQLSSVIQSIKGPVIAITTVPIVADVVGRLPVARWIYYCVDDFGEWPGLDQKTLRDMEATLVRKTDALIVVSETLQDKFAAIRPDVHLLTHGTDLDFWTDPGEGSPPGMPQELERPLIVFWGVIDRRMDVSLVRQLAADLDKGTIVLVGPEADPDPVLASLPRVVRLPPLPYRELPSLAREAEVLIMPYADLPVTRAMQPLKLKEYLATGKPVVVRDLPATRGWADALDLADTPKTFSDAVRTRLEEGLLPAQAQARKRLEQEGWDRKAAAFQSWAIEPHLSQEVLPCP